MSTVTSSAVAGATSSPPDAGAVLRVGYYQFCPAFARPDDNTAQILQTLETVEADLVVLPELALSGYHFQEPEELQAVSEDPQNSPRIDALIALCQRRDLYIVLGFAEKAQGRCFNSAALLGPEGLRHVYRKLHLFNEEKRLFAPGDCSLQVQEIKGVCIGMMICFDWAFPEVTRCLSLSGATLICHPCNLVLAHCQQAMRTRCLENRVYAVTANRFGVEQRPHGVMRFTGRSQIVAPDGSLVCQAPEQEEALQLVDLHPGAATDKHLTAHNDLFQDRRPEFYTALQG